MTESILRLRGVRPFDAHAFSAPGRSVPSTFTIEGGKITSIVPDADALGRERSSSGVRTLDLQGAWVLPAFADSHLHLHTLAQQRAVLRLSRGMTPEALAQSVREHAAELPPDAWLVAQGWHDPLAQHLAPTPRAWLDALGLEHPLWLFAADHHRTLLCSRALRAVGAFGPEHAGVLVEDALMDAWRAVPPLPADIPGTIADLHRVGITAATSFDGTEGRSAWERAIVAERAPLRVRHSVAREVFLESPEAWMDVPAEVSTDPFAVPWVKLFLDGTLGSRTAWLKSDYSDAPGERGDERIDSIGRAEIVEAIAPGRLGLAIHAIGDAAVAAAIDMIEAVRVRRRSLGISSPVPHRIEHVQLVDRVDLDRLARSGGMASMQACHLLEDAAVGPERFGLRCGGLFALRAVLERGIPLCLGSDAPIETIDPWVDIAAACSRIDRGGRFPRGWHPEERIEFIEAFRARTSGAAAANLLPRGWGRLAVGSPADLQVLGCADPRRVRSIEEAAVIDVLHAGVSVRGEERCSR